MIGSPTVTKPWYCTAINYITVTGCDPLATSCDIAYHVSLTRCGPVIG